MRDQYMRCGEGFMICYSVTDRHSFLEALEYRKLISRVRANEDTPLVLLGNKFDLQHQRKVEHVFIIRIYWFCMYDNRIVGNYGRGEGTCQSAGLPVL